MQEAVEEIVTLLTEERFRGKMVVIFAGYSGQMSELLDKVNPGLKSRVGDVVDFPDFTPELATEIALQQLQLKRLNLPARRARASPLHLHYISMHLHASPCISPHLPTSPHISPRLPASPHAPPPISRQAGARPRPVHGATCLPMYLPISPGWRPPSPYAWSASPRCRAGPTGATSRPSCAASLSSAPRGKPPRSTSPVPPLYRPCISPVSPLSLPCTSPTSPLTSPPYLAGAR